MHILIIHQAFSSLEDAGGTRHYETACFLQENGHAVTVITSPINYLTGKTKSRMQWIDRQVDENGIEILRTYTYSALHRSFVHRVISFLSFMVSSFLAALSLRKVDLVWGTSPPIFQGFTAWLVSRLKGAVFLFEVRDLWPEFAIAIGVLKNPLLIRLSRWLEDFLYTHADQVIVNSPGFLEHVSKKGAKAVKLIPNGADPDMFNSSSGLEQKAAWGLAGKTIVLYAGAHGLSNDLMVLLQAAEKIQARKDITFVLIGDGKEKDSLINQSEILKLDNVYFFPPVTKSAIADVFAAADICLAILKPLEWYKTTYPNKVFDAMAAGKPVILCIDGVIRELVERAGAGVFVEPGNAHELAAAVLKLADNPVLCGKLGVAGKAIINQEFSRKNISNELLAVMEELERVHDRNNFSS
ncbi:MAG: glycosyltransferase family 4 protein [Leptolinea sp.]